MLDNSRIVEGVVMTLRRCRRARMAKKRWQRLANRAQLPAAYVFENKDRLRRLVDVERAQRGKNAYGHALQ